MDCLQYARDVQSLIDEDLEPVERLLLEDHEGRCYRCMELRAETAGVFALLDSWERDRVPGGFAADVLARVGPARSVDAAPRPSVRALPGRHPIALLVVFAALAAAAIAPTDGTCAQLLRVGMGRFATAWYGWGHDLAAALGWLRDVSWADSVAIGVALRDVARPLLEAFGGQFLLCAAGILLGATAIESLARRRSTWRPIAPFAVLAACVAASMFASEAMALAAESDADRPRDELLRLEKSLQVRQASLDSLLQHIETLPQVAIEKSILEKVHALTEELREDRRSLRLLRDSVVPLAPEPAARAGRPVRPPRPPRPSRDDKVISQGLVRFSEDVEVRSGETVSGDAIVLDGDLWVNGRVEGNAITLGGNILLGRRASVTGQVIAIAGRVETTPGAEVGGQEMSLTLMPGNFAGSWPHWVSLVLDMFKLGFLLLVAGLFLAVVPDRMARARDQLGESFLKCFGVGLVVLFGGSFALVVSIMLLSITFVGIPAALLVAFATGVLLIASLFVGVLLVGDRLQELLNFRRRAPWVSVGLGLLFIMLPELLSDALRFAFPSGSGIAISLFSKGLVLVTVAAGLGALVLSKLGANEPGQTPQPSA